VALRIEGMTCDGCASAVEVRLSEIVGVTAYEVSFERAEALVRYDPLRTTPEKIARAIGVTGFTAWVKDGAPPACGPDGCRPSQREPGPAASTAELGVLDSLAPLLADFNAARGRPRFVAILSPTCGLCLHGADAVRTALLEDDAARALELFVVWAPMLAGDDEAGARAAAARVRNARVRQYYDPGKRVGAAFRQDVFPEAVAQMRASLPPGHFLAGPFAARDPAQPEWDIYLFFGAEAEWRARAPAPTGFVRQVVQQGSSSVVWRNDYARAPVEASLVEELRAAAAGLLKLR
jgi:copper chaperone CopZ